MPAPFDYLKNAKKDYTDGYLRHAVAHWMTNARRLLKRVETLIREKILVFQRRRQRSTSLRTRHRECGQMKPRFSIHLRPSLADKQFSAAG